MTNLLILLLFAYTTSQLACYTIHRLNRNWGENHDPFYLLGTAWFIKLFKDTK